MRIPFLMVASFSLTFILCLFVPYACSFYESSILVRVLVGHGLYIGMLESESLLWDRKDLSKSGKTRPVEKVFQAIIHTMVVVPVVVLAMIIRSASGSS